MIKSSAILEELLLKKQALCTQYQVELLMQYFVIKGGLQHSIRAKGRELNEIGAAKNQEIGDEA